MKKLLLYSLIASLSAVAFLPIYVSAQKSNPPAAKPAEKKPIDSETTAAKTLIPKPSAPKPVVAHTPSAMEQAVFHEINAARKDPQKYIAYLEEYKKLFRGRIIYLPNYLRIETSEGAAAVDEAIEFLRKTSAMTPFIFSNGLNKASAYQLKDLKEDSKIGHTSRDGSDLPTRLKKFGAYGNLYAENIAHFSETARDIVMRMIIDDGVKSRNHRNNIFSPDFRVVGVAFGKGKSGGSLCVVNFADSFRELNQKLTVTTEF
jgi:uncharacterized protein YkwD